MSNARRFIGEAIRTPERMASSTSDGSARKASDNMLSNGTNITTNSEIDQIGSNIPYVEEFDMPS